jgi:hypothetical protein
MRFVVATLHFAGRGFPLRLQDEGHEVILAPAGTNVRRLQDEYALVGRGLVPRRPLEGMMRPRRLAPCVLDLG